MPDDWDDKILNLLQKLSLRLHTKVYYPDLPTLTSYFDTLNMIGKGHTLKYYYSYANTSMDLVASFFKKGRRDTRLYGIYNMAQQIYKNSKSLVVACNFTICI